MIKALALFISAIFITIILGVILLAGLVAGLSWLCFDRKGIDPRDG